MCIRDRGMGGMGGMGMGMGGGMGGMGMGGMGMGGGMPGMGGMGMGGGMGGMGMGGRMFKFARVNYHPGTGMIQTSRTGMVSTQSSVPVSKPTLSDWRRAIRLKQPLMFR